MREFYRAISRRKERGFTLVELLVILALLAFAAALLAPALARTRPNSEIAQCRNNLRQIGQACAMYGQDYQDYLPGPCWAGAMNVYCWYPTSSPSEPTGPNRYFGSLAAYIARYLALPPPSSLVQTARVMNCPAYFKAMPSGASYTPPVSEPVPYYLHQFLRVDPNDDAGITARLMPYPFGRPNGPIIGVPTLPDGSAPQHKPTELSNPSQYWAITDDDRELNTGGTYALWLPDKAAHGRSGNKPVRNFLYFDWHVQTETRAVTGNP